MSGEFEVTRNITYNLNVGSDEDALETVMILQKGEHEDHVVMKLAASVYNMSELILLSNALQKAVDLMRKDARE